METIVGFENPSNEVVWEKSGSYKPVPWICWDEWNSVKESLFSNSHLSVLFALQRISTWRSRGCLPVVIEVTASIIEIQQKDPFFRSDLGDKNGDSDEILAMLYCMSILRLVNGVLEKTRIRSQFSIAQAAAEIGLPRTLIDIRHEGSHRDLPSLNRLRPASVEALDWLKAYYWEPQRNRIPFQSNEKGLIKEIKSTFLELNICLNSTANGKRSNKAMKKLVRLNASFSSEVISVLFKILKRVRSQNVFDRWKPMLSKLSKKEPQLLLRLLNAVLDMIKTEEDQDQDQDHSSEYLLNLFDWLVGILKGLKSSLGDEILVKLIRKCLLLSSTRTSLRDSSLVLAKMVRNHSSLVKNLNKLFSVGNLPDKMDEEEHPFNLEDEEVAFRKADEKLESLKLHCMNSLKTVANEDKKKWVVANGWNSCPIGLLPDDIGSSGHLPDLKWINSEVSGQMDSEKCEVQMDFDCSDAKKRRMNESPTRVQVNDELGRLLIHGAWKGVGVQDLDTIVTDVGVFVGYL